MDKILESKTGISIDSLIRTITSNHLHNFGSNSKNIHSMMVELIESPLLDAVMQHSKYNQVRAAKLLGISRGNLRQKLVKHFDDKYCGTRQQDSLK